MNQIRRYILSELTLPPGGTCAARKFIKYGGSKKALSDKYKKISDSLKKVADSTKDETKGLYSTKAKMYKDLSTNKESLKQIRNDIFNSSSLNKHIKDYPSKITPIKHDVMFPDRISVIKKK